MQEGAKKAAADEGIDITIASGKEEGDDQGQIDAIENAITAQQKGILITPMSTGVNDAIQKARDAGLFVIALDTPTDPPDAVDITFATDNRKAGNLIGQYAAAKLDGKKAVIALLDIFDDKVVSVDYNRDQGFLEGMGIKDIGDPKINGDEPKTGKYCGGDYEIVGNVATGANEEGGRTGMEQLLSKNGDINVVYTINEPTAAGASAALKAAGKKDVIVVSVDGGRAGVEAVQAGTIAATSQQYPAKMVELGVKAIIDIVKTGNEAGEHRRPRLLRHRGDPDRQRAGRRRREQGRAVRPRQRVGLMPAPKARLRRVRWGRSLRRLPPPRASSAERWRHRER